MRSARAALGAAVSAALVVTLLTSGVRAESTSGAVSLRYERGFGADRCPDETALRAEIAARLGRDPFVADAARLILVHIEAKDGTLTAQLRVLDAVGNVTGRARYDSGNPDCDELAEAVALAVAIAIDPLSRMAGTPAPDPVREAPTITTTPRTAVPVHASSPPSNSLSPLAPTHTARAHRPSPRRAYDRAHLGAVIGLGLAPGTSYGLRAGLARNLPFGSYGVEGHFFTSKEQALGGGALRALGVHGAGSLCTRADVFSACALATVGGTFAAGAGFRTDRTALVPFIAIGGRAGVHVNTPGARIGVHAELHVPATRIVFELDDRPVWTAPAVIPALAATLGWRWP